MKKIYIYVLKLQDRFTRGTILAFGPCSNSYTLYDKELNLDDAVDIFAKLHPRRMDLQSIIFHDE